MQSRAISEDSVRLLLPASRSFIPSLNGFRAISICLVLLDHAIPAKIIPGGFAVSVFFFISGFLITRLVLDEYASTGAVDLTRFYIARAFRLFPALAAALFYALAVTYTLGLEQSPLAIASVVFYFANYVHGINSSLLPTIAMDQAWSLSVEEHFYLIYPALMLWALRSWIRPFVVLISAITIAMCLRIVYHFMLSDISSTYIFSATETRMDFIAYGCVAALICTCSRGGAFVDFTSRRVVFWGAGGLVMLSLGIRDPFFRDTVRYYLQGAALLILVPAMVFGPQLAWARRLLNLQIVDWIGRISYSLYLFHFASFYVGSAVAGRVFGKGMIFTTASGIAIGFVLSFVLANASYCWIEQPFLRMRRSFTKESSTQKSHLENAHPA